MSAPPTAIQEPPTPILGYTMKKAMCSCSCYISLLLRDPKSNGPHQQGQSMLSAEVMLINFATEQKLVILADEVYQENVYREAASSGSNSFILWQTHRVPVANHRE